MEYNQIIPHDTSDKMYTHLIPLIRGRRGNVIIINCIIFLMTMFCNIDKKSFAPAEEKVADGAAQNDGHEEPHVVGHDDQHEQIGNDHLEKM
jgi:hypothetical protein